MFLIERIIGVLTFSAGLFFFFILLNNVKEKQERIVINAYTVFLIILAYFYIPGVHADLNRYIEYSKHYNSLSFDNFTNLVKESSAPVNIIYFYIIGKTGNSNLIPAITCMIFYGLSFNILINAFYKYNFSKKELSDSLLLFMATGVFLSVISVIRSYLSLAIVSSCIYYEVVNKRSLLKNLPFYILAILIHPAAFMMFIFRIVFEILFSMSEKKINIIYKSVFFILFIVILFISRNYIYDVIFRKATFYIVEDGYNYIWEYLLNIIFLIFSSIYVYKNNKITDTIQKEVIRLGKVIIVLNIILTVFIFEYSIFTRFQIVSVLLFIPYFSICQKYGIKINKYLFYFIVILMLIISCTRGNLSGYKYLLFT